MSFRIDKAYIAQIFKQLELLDEWSRQDDRTEAMSVVNDYLYAAYFVSINALPGLRKVLSQYRWTFHRLPYSTQKAARVVGQSDFIWCTNAFGGPPDADEEKIELVTAKLIEPRESLRLFYAGKKSAYQKEDVVQEIEFAYECGGKPVY